MPAVAGIGVSLLLAYANGANDNFKGVACLYGGGIGTFRKALVWATVTTASGCLASYLAAGALLARFSGKGLVPDAVAVSGSFPVAVALAAAATVTVATRAGLPVSTTHALLGALAGAGLLASPSGVNLSVLASGFVMPLLAGPLAAVIAASTLYPVCRAILGVARRTTTNAPRQAGPPAAPRAPGMLAARTSGVAVSLAALPKPGRVDPMRQAGAGLWWLHYVGAGVVSFARGLNDAPKIAALMLIQPAVPAAPALILVTAAMALGGWFGARPVAETMAHRVTALDAERALVANWITGGLVTAASVLGLPMSTTHVSCGALFGIGIVSGEACCQTIGRIVGAWTVTLPLAMALGALAIRLLNG